MANTKIVTLQNKNGELIAPRTGAAAVSLANGKFVETALGGCWIEFTDENGNPTDEPYIHWYVETPDVTLITFTIDGTSYQGEEGMTWSEWVDSSYNTEGFYRKYEDPENGDIIADSTGTAIADASGNDYLGNTLIESNGTYYFSDLDLQ